MKREVYIVFTAAKSWYSRFLRWVTGAEVSHVGVEYISYDYGEMWLVEGSKIGTVAIPVRNSRGGVVRRMRCRYEVKHGLESLSKHIGVGYDYRGAFLMGLYLFLKKIWNRIRRPTYSTINQKCSELMVDFILADNDISEIAAWDREWVTPQMILDACLARPHLFEADPWTRSDGG